jgi:putative phosphoesterase
MRFTVLADVHGNLPALEAVLADLHHEITDGIIVAGDLTGGPQPNETIQLLRSLNSHMIVGNSDLNLLKYEAGQAPDSWRTHLQFGLLRWSHHNLSQKNYAYLKSLPEQLSVEVNGKTTIRVVHGSPRSPWESIYPQRDPGLLETIMSMVDEKVLVCGHTHEPWGINQNGKIGLNPGAVCGPLNGQVGAQYALLEGEGQTWQVEHRIVSYDLERLHVAFHESGLLEEGGALAKAFWLSNETGQNVGEDFLSYAYELASQAGFVKCEVVPDNIWQEASHSFVWKKYKTEARPTPSQTNGGFE